ncbi:MAG: SUMF1/EgtB/PvdO family nonheme iron enzyme [bacterium]
MSLKCSKCGTENTEDSVFCKKCGEKLTPPPPPPPSEKTTHPDNNSKSSPPPSSTFKQKDIAKNSTSEDVFSLYRKKHSQPVEHKFKSSEHKDDEDTKFTKFTKPEKPGQYKSTSKQNKSNQQKQISSSSSIKSSSSQPNQDLPHDLKVPDYLENKQNPARKILIFGIVIVLLLIILAGFIFIPRIKDQFFPASSIQQTGYELPGLVLVPGGIYRIGSYKAVFNDEVPNFKVELDSFYMKQTPVTNYEFSKFINETGYLTYAERDSSIGFWTDSTGYQHDGANWRHPRGMDGPDAVFDLPLHPVVQVTWYDAAIFCNWLSEKENLELQYDTITWECKFTNGYRLPTEFEWEAAAQGLRRSTYPWGENSPKATADSAQANHAGYLRVGEFIEDQQAMNFSSIMEHMRLDGYQFTSPVDAFPPNDLGLYDMAGNVWEWCQNYYDLYPPETYTNPRGFEDSEYKAMRGGSYGHDYRYLRRSARGKNVPYTAVELIGFRVMRLKSE